MTDLDPGPEGRQVPLPREAAVRRLIALDAEGRLATEHVVLAAEGLAVSERTVWRWVEAARASGQLDRRHKGRFVVTDQVRERLAFWRGNVAAVHRELVEAAGSGGPPAPSRQTLQRAVERDVLRGDRVGLRRLAGDPPGIRSSPARGASPRSCRQFGSARLDDLGAAGVDRHPGRARRQPGKPCTGGTGP